MQQRQLQQRRCELDARRGAAHAVQGLVGAMTCTYVRFHVECGSLEVERVKRARPLVPYKRHVCKHCEAGVVKDTVQVLWECPACK